MKTLYEKHHSEGLEIICISVDIHKNEWVATVEELIIDEWYNIWAAQNYEDEAGPFTKNDGYSNFYFGAIPQTLLIDRDGIIIGSWIESTPENEESLDRLLVEKLNQYKIEDASEE
jgi:peroxiredoxin